MKIYTKTGDRGETGLFGGGRVPKDDARVDSYGEVDELNAAVGLARSLIQHAELDKLCQAIQDELFTVGAVLATPQGSKADAQIPHVRPEWSAAMEAQMDLFEKELPPLTSFVLPGGSQAASALHVARTVCRRAERRVVPLARAGTVSTEVVVYLNRLSDYLFTLARVANHRAGVPDVPWLPRVKGSPAP
jgi:cob(I)alamin adenosyltransferase